MTFNRYILFRMVVEFVGAIACAIQMFQHHTWPGIITTIAVAAGADAAVFAPLKTLSKFFIVMAMAAIG